MLQSWRWFGPKDRVLIDEVMQAGASGIVTALHHIRAGEVWSIAEIAKRKEELGRMSDGAPSHLRWVVAESLPVSEDIKRQSGDYRNHFTNYRESLKNLAAEGVEVICYNFMPVLDWTRTDLRWRLANGATCMRFDLVDFAAYDIHLLERKGARESFAPDIAEATDKRIAEMSEARKRELAHAVLGGLPGSVDNLKPSDVREHLALYDGVSEDRLRANLVDFLSEVAPTAESLGLRLCCHPDDPPFPLLGLPRVMSTQADYKHVLDSVDIPANGVTLCAGSLGARPDNDLPAMMRALGPRVHFLHLRNVRLEEARHPGSFHEAAHLEGNTDMVALIAEIVAEEARRKAEGRSDAEIPMRPDHGQDILDDGKRQAQPGYPAIGRLKGLAELRGIELALKKVAAGAVAVAPV